MPASSSLAPAQAHALRIPELLGLVVSELDPASLLNASLVSHSWRDHSQERIYASFEPKADDLHQSLGLLLRTLRARPDLARRVRCVNLATPAAEKDDAPCPANAAESHELLKLCVNATEVTISRGRGNAWLTLLESVTTLRPDITRLTLSALSDEIHNDLAPVLPHLVRLPNLRHLQLQRFWISPDALAALPRPAYSLTSFTIQDVVETDASFAASRTTGSTVAWLAGDSTSSLAELSVLCRKFFVEPHSRTRGDASELLRSFAPAVKRLALCFDEANNKLLSSQVLQVLDLVGLDELEVHAAGALSKDEVAAHRAKVEDELVRRRTLWGKEGGELSGACSTRLAWK